MKNPWHASYDESVPRSIEVPDLTLHEVLFRTARRNPLAIAIIEGDIEINYSELSLKVLDFAAGLIQIGISTGKRIAIILPNQIDFFTAYFGCLAAGCTVVALNPALTSSELDRIFVDSKIKGVICSPEHLLTIEKTGYAKKHPLHIFTNKDFPNPNNQYLSINHLISLGKGTSEKLPTVRSRDPAIFQYTGGTTGVPKAAVALHRNVIANVFQFSNWLPMMNNGTVTVLAALPLFHVYGMVLIMCLSIYWGATIVIPSSLKNPESIISLANQHQVNFAPLAPSLIRSMVLSMEKNGLSIPSLRVCISGSAALMDQDKVNFEKHIGGVVLEGYGLSEAPTATHCNPMNRQKIGSIGLPLPNVQCKITQRVLSRIFPNQQSKMGELLLKGPQVMKKYNRDWISTLRVLQLGWLHTGDYAQMDEDGYFYIVGRKKEMIKVNGLQVWPQEVEKVITQIISVKEAAVAGLFDRVTGEKVVAWVVAKEGVSIDSQFILDHCRRHLARYKLPSEILFLDDLPKNQVGKILKRILIQRYHEKLKRAL